jgi:hypothetical protein
MASQMVSLGMGTLSKTASQFVVITYGMQSTNPKVALCITEYDANGVHVDRVLLPSDRKNLPTSSANLCGGRRQRF